MISRAFSSASGRTFRRGSNSSLRRFSRSMSETRAGTSFASASRTRIGTGGSEVGDVGPEGSFVSLLMVDDPSAERPLDLDAMDAPFFKPSRPGRSEGSARSAPNASGHGRGGRVAASVPGRSRGTLPCSAGGGRSRGSPPWSRPSPRHRGRPRTPPSSEGCAPPRGPAPRPGGRAPSRPRGPPHRGSIVPARRGRRGRPPGR